MAVSESSKHDLYRELERLVGKKRAETFMDMVTTVPWSEVATRADIQALRSEMASMATKSELQALRAEMTAWGSGMATKAELERMGRRITVWTSSMVVTMAILAFTAGRAI